jgi:hypothetical protein
MPKNLICDWSTQFMKVILLGLSLVSTSLQYSRTETGLQYKRTAVQLIQAKCVHLKCVKVVSSCTAVVYAEVQSILVQYIFI